MMLKTEKVTSTVSRVAETKGRVFIKFTYTRAGGDLSESLTIRYTLSGTATPEGEGDSEADYASPPGGAGYGGVYSLTFAANEEQKTLNLTPLNDTTAEAAESVILSLRSDEDYRLGSSRTATVNIQDDNDVEIYSLTVSDNANPPRTVTNNSKSTLTELYVGMTTGQANAVIYLDASGSPDTSQAGAQVLWQIEGGNSSPNLGNFSSNPTITLTPHVSNTQNKFIVRAGVDANGDGSLNDDPGGGASEVTHAVTVYVVEIDEMFVWDNADSANIVTAPNSTPLDLYVAETANGNAAIKVDVSGRPQTSAAGANVLWSVAGNTASPTSGNFGGVDPTVTLTPTSTNRQFIVTLGFDDNANQTLEAVEVERTVNVYVVQNTEYTIQVSSFISQEWVSDPRNANPLFTPIIYQGDFRGYSRTSNSYRLRQAVTVVPYEIYDVDGEKNGTFANLGGVSTSYDKATSLDSTGTTLLQAAKDDPVLGDGLMKLDYGDVDTDNMQIIVERLGPSQVQVTFHAAAADALIQSWAAVDIDLDFIVMIDASDPIHPKYTIYGSHDQFPNYDIYINNQRIYGFDSGSTGFEGLYFQDVFVYDLDDLE